jgi:hypothetical protein
MAEIQAVIAALMSPVLMIACGVALVILAMLILLDALEGLF